MKRGRTATSEFATGHLMPGRPSLLLSSDGKVATGRDGLEVDYKGDDACPYGSDATRKKGRFAGLVIHHTGPDHDTDWYVAYQIRGDRDREPPGHFGYHFFVSPSGRIVQGAPLSKRTNHVSPKRSVRLAVGTDLQNTNSIGITCVGAGKSTGSDPTDEQEEAVAMLAFALCDLFSIPFSSVYGHGEIQSNRMRSEGRELAMQVRSWQSDLHERLVAEPAEALEFDEVAAAAQGQELLYSHRCGKRHES